MKKILTTTIIFLLLLSSIAYSLNFATYFSGFKTVAAREEGASLVGSGDLSQLSQTEDNVFTYGGAETLTIYDYKTDAGGIVSKSGEQPLLTLPKGSQFKSHDDGTIEILNFGESTPDSPIESKMPIRMGPEGTEKDST